LVAIYDSLNLPPWKCGGQKMVPHANKWSLLDGAHELQVTVIVTTSESS